MPKLGAAAELKRLVAELQEQRNEHMQAIAAIDRTFSDLGIGGGAPAVKRGRPVGSGRKAVGAPRGPRKRRRGSFAVTAEESILKFVAANGNATTKDVNGHWQNEGRKGKADNTLTRLVKEKKLKRSKIKGERGSKYAAA